MRRLYQEAARALCAAHRVVLAGHVNPDGDTLGSALALAHLLRAREKDVVVLSADGVPDIYRWLPGADGVQTGTDRRDFDLAVVCDAGALDRVGASVLPVIASAARLMDIDHHVGDAPFGDLRLLDARAAATSEIVFQLGQLLGPITRPVATCLMTGIITDTGSFRFPNTTPRTFQIAARLQRCGAVPAEIFELVFENRSLAGLKLLGRALDRLQVSGDGRVAWTVLTAEDMRALGATDADTEGIVTHVRAVKTAQAGLLFREIPGGKIRVSLRGREGVPVHRIAARFGGGGHPMAAGCSLPPPLSEAVQTLLAEVRRYLDAGEPSAAGGAVSAAPVATG
ncbi:MAG: bifunctional oligoribonuclease/PAP phosphatase NrnA [Chloroherpetonaceae bacterium]|nr:bifunctional oligoribonuclease/PAP phosphatase NrnA [Chthonomonadaceae bacterium]MDW8206326.1 bifunctional oligoribonuclease/PAP phosphatase NrnA [Chloroherpetonaceae bacterium]